MSAKYRWKAGSRLKIKPQIAGERLDLIRKKHGTLTPSLVVEDAKAKSSPLHTAFEWSDTAAAKKFREQQASYLLRSIEVVIVLKKREKPQPVRAFLNIKQRGQRSYETSARVMGNTELREQLLREAWQELQDWRKRYERLREFASVVSAIDKVKLPGTALKKAA